MRLRNGFSHSNSAARNGEAIETALATETAQRETQKREAYKRLQPFKQRSENGEALNEVKREA